MISQQDNVINQTNKQSNLWIDENQEHKTVFLKIYGEIEEPSVYLAELAELERLSKTMDILEITLNSPGGSLNTAIDLATIIDNFPFVITIGKGSIASAAFMLWTMGNVRVATDYSMYMAHRESYGMYGKTSEHRDAAHTFGTVYEEMFDNCFGDLLTEEESLIADRSEVWISYKDLLSRDHVISYEEYKSPIQDCIVSELYQTPSNKTFAWDDELGCFRNVTITFGNEIITNMTEYMYGMVEPHTLPAPQKEKKKTGRKTTKNVKLNIDNKSEKRGNDE